MYLQVIHNGAVLGRMNLPLNSAKLARVTLLEKKAKKLELEWAARPFFCNGEVKFAFDVSDIGLGNVKFFQGFESTCGSAKTNIVHDVQFSIVDPRDK